MAQLTVVVAMSSFELLLLAPVMNYSQNLQHVSSSSPASFTVDVSAPTADLRCLTTSLAWQSSADVLLIILFRCVEPRNELNHTDFEG